MGWNMIYELIDPALIVVVAMCWCIGYVLKQTPRVPDWTIVYIVTVIAVFLTVWMIGFSPEALIQGVLCGAFSVFGHQIIKQTTKRGGSKQ
ncbi:phage holin family protein [Paenibacillus sp. MER 180]|uniref:phage holin family protein n=1 Tax=Paenibacillus sp. MER 180 TaxID=2939570 RepID=UPI00203F1124|nr:phage holin family protein [Paenibacillus sp. MER 180]MCM3294133.1 phage holin family protein [Paenibacillus sp. MER 180]